MSGQVWWHTARATGLVAWALSAAAVAWGIAHSLRLTTRPRPAWTLDLHRFIGGLTVAFTAAHVGALVADSYVQFDLADLTVPFASAWRPGAVAWGILAVDALIAVEVTSLLMRRLPRRVWHGIHLLSYAVYAAATAHALAAGHDAANPVMQGFAVATATLILFLTFVRGLSGRRRRSPARPERRGEERVAA